MRIAPPASFPLSHAGPLLRQSQTPSHFVQQLSKRKTEYALPRIEHHIHRPGTGLRRVANGFPHTAADAIALHRPTQHLAHGKTDSWPARYTVFGWGFAPKKKYRHVTRELPAPVLVDPLKVRMLQQMPRLRKLAAGGGGHIQRSAPTPPNLPFVLRPSLAAVLQNPTGKAAVNAELKVFRFNRGSQGSRRRACVPWRAGATAPPARSWSSYENESRASSSGDDGWVGMCAWACENCAPHWP
jgi:hypothetical protein